jgi:hypothetical protein
VRVSLRQSAKFDRLMAEEFLKGEKAVTQTMRSASATLKAKWRAQVVSAGLGSKLGNTIRGESYPKSTDSMNAAALVYTNAPKIIGAHNSGPLIRSKDGFWLAIPTEAAGKGRRGESISPGEWERRRGVRLRFVYRRNKPSLLVADDARINTRGQAARKGGRRRQDGILTGAQTVVVFILVPQVKLKKRLDLFRDAEAVANAIPAAIVANWRD